MSDTSESNATPDSREVLIKYFDGTELSAKIVDREVPFPEGRLIVSRTDLKGVITHFNRSFVEMSGYSESELMNQPHSILRHPDMPAAAFADLWQTIEKRVKWQGYVKNLRTDGAYYWVFATVVPNVRHGELVGYTSVRRKPSRQKVEECITLYATMNAAASN